MKLGRIPFSSEERLSLFGYYLFLAVAHLLGWGLLIWLSIGRPQMLALGALAYGFGVRHAFDADHIAAVDNVTRKLLHDGANPLGTGFYFSLGHSSVVFAVAIALGFLTRGAISGLTAGLARVGGVVGTVVSGVCLLLIGIMNLVVLIQLWKHFRGGAVQASTRESETADAPVIAGAPGGLLTRLFGRFFRLLSRSRQMYFVGALFGLGFDTASEIALLALSATSAASGWPFLSVVTLPLLFAAGMGLIDTSDGVLMAKAYSWSSQNRKRGEIYNIIVTSASVCVALAIGGIELLHLPVSLPFIQSAAQKLMAHIDFWAVGATITAGFLLAWFVASIVQVRRKKQLDRPASES